jgi:hypothetical protein
VNDAGQFPRPAQHGEVVERLPALSARRPRYSGTELAIKIGRHDCKQSSSVVEPELEARMDTALARMGCRYPQAIDHGPSRTRSRVASTRRSTMDLQSIRRR